MVWYDMGNSIYLVDVVDMVSGKPPLAQTANHEVGNGLVVHVAQGDGVQSRVVQVQLDLLVETRKLVDINDSDQQPVGAYCYCLRGTVFIS